MSLDEFASLLTTSQLSKAEADTLGDLVNRAFRDKLALSFEYVISTAKIRRPEALAWILGQLIQSGMARTIYRVESPVAHGPIAEFNTLEDIPLEIDDWRTGDVVTILPGLIKVLYKFGT